MHLFHPTCSSPIQKYQKKIERKKWHGYIEKKSKSLKNENKMSKYRKQKKRWTKWSQINIEWNIIQRSLFETTLTSLVWAFTIIHFHTPSLGHDTSLIKFTQIKDWLLSFVGFNLEENFDLLPGLFYKKGKKKKTEKVCSEIFF